MVVAHACSLQSSVTTTQAKLSAPMLPDCVAMGSVSTPDGDHLTPLCVAHCEQSSPSHRVSVPDLPSVSLVPLFEIPPVDTRDLLSRTFVRSLFLFLTEGSPPLRIQYQVFRI